MMRRRVVWIGAVAAVAAVVVVAVVALLIFGGSDGGEPSQHSGVAWQSSTTTSLEGRNLLFFVYGFHTGPPFDSQIRVIDRDTGKQVGEIDAGEDPLVVYAPAKGELIVTDRPWIPDMGPLMGPTGNPIYRMLIFDVGSGLTLKSQTNLPGDREPAESPPHSLAELGQMALSNDERYLYYEAAATMIVAIVDLDGLGTSSVPMAEHYDFATLYPRATRP